MEVRYDYTDCERVGGSNQETCAEYLENLPTNSSVVDRYCNCVVNVTLDQEFTVSWLKI